MPLLIGTRDRVVRVPDVPFGSEDVERVLDEGHVTSLQQFDRAPGIFATTANGAYRSNDGGRTWAPLGAPTGDSAAWSVLATDEETLYVGTNDPVLYRSTDGGESWSELRGFRELPSRSAWQSPVDPDRARLRTLVAPPDDPNRLVAGIESGGIHVSDDGGETWMDRRGVLQDDVHRLLALSQDVYLAVTGYLDLALESLDVGHAHGLGGIYRTTDGGETWTRLDVGSEHSYIRDVFVHDGRTYFCGASRAPPEWRTVGPDAALFESPNLGRTFDRVDYPGEPMDFIQAWTAADGEVLAGGGRYDAPRPNGTSGLILLRESDGEYHTVGTLTENVTSIESVR